ncbi:hypothetical protein [Niallia sp. 01092]|uniref:hypothetical protein n=1 Tax=unclassified Niallia TaxID=2837522 RepID=UPI003FD4FB9B
MELSYKFITQAIPNAKGFGDDNIIFQTVSFYAGVKQPKGLFVPLFGKESGELDEAIANGAIGTIWEKEKPIPAYTPNHFPIFYTNDLKKGLKKMIEIYEHQLVKGSNTTKFIYQQETSLNKEKETYDIAVIAEIVKSLLAKDKKGGE